MHTGKDNDKDLRPVIKCDAELHCAAAPQLYKTVAEDLIISESEDKDIEKLLQQIVALQTKKQESPSARE